MIYLDKIILSIFKQKHNLNKKVKLKNYIQKELILRNDTLVVLCPPWHVGKLSTSILRFRLKQKKYSFLTYDINVDVLSSDYKSTGIYIETIINTISEDINILKKKHNFKKIYLIGFSLGNLYAINVSIKNKNVDKLIIASTGYSLADCVWHGYSTQKIKNAMIKHYGLTFEKLNKAWKNTHLLDDPKNIKFLNDKEIMIFGSKNDLLTKYDSLTNFLNVLDNNNIKYIKKINTHLGHYGTIVLFLLFPRKYL